MNGASVVYDYWRGRIPKDLTPFTDPGTDLELSGEGRSLTAQWVCRGVERQAQFSISPEKITVSFLGKTYGYSSFLVCTEMADLLGLAKMILQAQKPHIFISTKASITDDAESTQNPAVELLESILEEGTDAATKILMVTGEAGAGKTRVLQELVRRQAESYIAGQTTTLYLYVNAQGRALARLGEALATELQDLRALLTYHSVASLVRAGVLVPIIDGFDELIGVSGYDDAFSSLARFIEELGGLGQIVASARSTYYEEEFVSRTAVASSLGGQFWTQVPVQVKSWGTDEFEEYVRQRIRQGQSVLTEEEAIEALNNIFSGISVDLKKKPLFVSRAVDLVLEGISLEGGDDLLNELVDAYLERERKEKLLDKNESPLLSKDTIAHLLSSLAEEMWNQETRELDRRSVRDIAEYVLSIENAIPATQSIVIERMPSLAFLSPGDSPGSIKFEHELFFSVFLARTICESLKVKSGSMRITLGRSVLPPEISHILVSQEGMDVFLKDLNVLKDMIERISEAGYGQGTRIQQVRENSGKIAIALMQAYCRNGLKIRGIEISNIVFAGDSLAGIEIHESKLDNIIFRRADLSDARIVNCQARDVFLQEVIVKPGNTRMELIGIIPEMHIFGLRVYENGNIRPAYDPDEMQHALEACGTVSPSLQPLPRRVITPRKIKLIEKFVRAYNRANPLCISDDNLRSIFGDSEWLSIQKKLLQAGVITLEIRATGGRPKEFLRRQVLPEEILSGIRKDATVPLQVKKFWESMEDQM